MKLLALVLLLSAFSSLILTEVVEDFKRSCPSFFFQKSKKLNGIIVPTVFKGHRYKQICQRWKEEYRFATLYDTEMRIPVFSAYTFLKKVNTTRSKVWNIEPQLDNIEVPEGTDVREMMNSPRNEEIVTNIKKQAVDSDYSMILTNYTRGHVFPRSFAANQSQADSTFTLTNAAPQTNYCNGNWAKEVEEKMLTNITDNCRLDQNHLAYIVTGVVPGKKKWISIRRGNEINERGINIPSHYWSAFCCTSKNNKLIGRAYIAKLGKFKHRSLSIDDLYTQLRGLYGQNFSVFPGLSIENLKPPF